MVDTFNLCSKMDDAEGKCLSCGAPLPEGREEQRKFTGGQMGIVVLSDKEELGEKLFNNAKNAIAITGKNISCEIIDDEEIIGNYGVRKLPALIINGSIVSQGIISETEEIVSEIEYMY